MPGLIFKGCTDPRVPNGRIIRALQDLEAALMPKPGVRFEIGAKHASFYRETQGRTPCVIAPHKGACLAWADKGGDDAGFDYGGGFAEYFAGKGIPALALGLLDGEPPVVIYDGLTKCGRGDVMERMYALMEDPDFNWSFQHDVVAKSVTIGHYFQRLPYRDVLRFASCGLDETTVPVVATVVEHYGHGPLPLYYSQELGTTRRGLIGRMLTEHKVPVLLPA